MQKINLRDKLALINDHWNPRIVGELNGQYLKLVKFKGPFSWHHHETEDEMFLVVKGRFRMEFRERSSNSGNSAEPSEQKEVWLEAGEFIVVPHGVEHRPVADEEGEVLLFEPASTLNTGNARDQFTVTTLDWI